MDETVAEGDELGLFRLEVLCQLSRPAGTDSVFQKLRQLILLQP